MIEFVKIEYSELSFFVEVAYEYDCELLEKYHVAVYDLQDAVKETMRMIEVTAQDVESNGEKMLYFGVLYEGNEIGYCVVFKNNLYSFGINIGSRTKEILSQFWSKIKEILGDKFITMLYPNNTRAISWLKKCGMKEIEDAEQFCVTLINFN